MYNTLTELIFSSIITTLSELVAVGCALLYFRKVRQERPAVGVFNGRDVAVLLFFIAVVPLIFLVLPDIALVVVLVLIFAGGMYLGLRRIMRPLYFLGIAALLIGSDIWVTYHYLGTRLGWQVYWAINSIIILLVAVSVSNLYVQGGMRLRHVAWFSFVLAFYDAFFIFVIPLTQRLADRFIGRPLDAAMGFTMGVYNANIGLGDLLVFCCFAIAAYKGFGKRGAITAFLIVAIFGGILPSLVPLVVGQVVRGTENITVPAQMIFGPAALVTYLLLARRTKERSMKEWLALEAAEGRVTAPGSRIVRRVAEQPALADVQRSVQGSD